MDHRTVRYRLGEVQAGGWPWDEPLPRSPYSAALFTMPPYLEAWLLPDEDNP